MTYLVVRQNAVSDLTMLLHAVPFQPSVGWSLFVLDATSIVLGSAFAGFVLATGRFLANRTHYRFCLVMAGVECMFIPFGTLLGVFTVLVLVREAVQQQFTVEPPRLRRPGTF